MRVSDRPACLPLPAAQSAPPGRSTAPPTPHFGCFLAWRSVRALFTQELIEGGTAPLAAQPAGHMPRASGWAGWLPWRAAQPAPLGLISVWPFRLISRLPSRLISLALSLVFSLALSLDLSLVLSLALS